MKSLSQEEILEAWALRPRPMRVKKVWTSGTKGVGAGTESFFVGLVDFDTERCCCSWKCWCRRHGAQIYLEDGDLEDLRMVPKRGDMGFEVAILAGG